MKEVKQYRANQARRLFIMLLLVGFSPFSCSPTFNSSAQDICIPERLKVTTISGQVVFSSKEGEELVPMAALELSEDKADWLTIEKISADENGCFKFPNLKPGKYMLRAAAPHLSPYIVRIQVIKSSKATKLPSHIIINLGAKPLDPCGGGYVKTRESIKPCCKLLEE